MCADIRAPNDPNVADLNALRRRLRAQRRGLTRAQQRRAAQRLLRVLVRTPFFRGSRHIACYFAADGEIDLRPVMQRIWQGGRQCYVPILRAGRRLRFARVAPHARLVRNRLNILEPAHTHATIAARDLDLILMPLVAFDPSGQRLGMGGGYYDRTLAFLHRRARVQPRLIGIAHDFQRVEKLTAHAWDVRMRAVATDRRYYSFF